MCFSSSCLPPPFLKQNTYKAAFHSLTERACTPDQPLNRLEDSLGVSLGHLASSRVAEGEGLAPSGAPLMLPPETETARSVRETSR